MPFTIKSGDDSITVDTAEEAVALSDAFWRATIKTSGDSDEIQSGDLLKSVLAHKAIRRGEWTKNADRLILGCNITLTRQEQLRGLAIALGIAQPTPLGTVLVNAQLGALYTDALIRINELETSLREIVADWKEPDGIGVSGEWVGKMQRAVQTLAEQAEARQLARSPGSTP